MGARSRLRCPRDGLLCSPHPSSSSSCFPRPGPGPWGRGRRGVSSARVAGLPPGGAAARCRLELLGFGWCQTGGPPRFGNFFLSFSTRAVCLLIGVGRVVDGG
jgi:hypothetical protein